VARLKFVLTVFIFCVSITGCLNDSDDSVVTNPNTVLYNIDFESPKHTVGLAPAVGDGPVPRDTVSSVNVGTPLITANFGAVNSQALQFDSSDNQGDQVSINLNDLPSSNLYCFEADVLINSIFDITQPFTIFFDTPQIRRIDFKSDGKIQPFVPLLGAATTGDYSFDVEINIKVEINLNLDQWNIYTDDALMHSGGFGSATAIDTIRISTPITASPASVITSVDNIRISNKGCQIN